MWKRKRFPYTPFCIRTNDPQDEISGTLLTWPADSQELARKKLSMCNMIEGYDEKYLNPNSLYARALIDVYDNNHHVVRKAYIYYQNDDAKSGWHFFDNQFTS